MFRNVNTFGFNINVQAVIVIEVTVVCALPFDFRLKTAFFFAARRAVHA